MSIKNIVISPDQTSVMKQNVDDQSAQRIEVERQITLFVKQYLLKLNVFFYLFFQLHYKSHTLLIRLQSIFLYLYNVDEN